MWRYVLVFLVFEVATAQSEANYEALQEASFQLIFQDKAEAARVIDSLIATHDSQSDYYKGRNYSNKGVYHAVYNTIDLAITNFETAAELIDIEHVFYPKLLNNLAIAYKKTGRYKKALERLYEALDIAQSRSDNQTLGMLYGELASVYKGLNDYDRAVNTVLKSITIFEDDTLYKDNLPFEKQKLANLYRLMGNYDFALEIYRELLPYFESSDYIDAKVSTLINYALALLNTGQNIEAKTTFEKVDKIFETYSNDELASFFFYAKALFYTQYDSFEVANAYYLDALKHANGIVSANTFSILNSYLEFLNLHQRYEQVMTYAEYEKAIDLSELGKVDLINFYSALAVSATELKLYKTQAQYLTKVNQLRNDLQDTKNFIIAKDLQAKYQNEIIEQRNTILQERVVSETRKTLAIFGFSLAIGILFTSLMFRYKNKLRTKNKLALALEEKLEAEQKMLKFKDALLETQRKELLSRTYQTIAEQTLNKNKKSSAEKDKSKNNRLHPNQLALSQLNSDFERYYPMFKAKLLKQYPNLTKKDLEFLSFIKLKFTYKDVAKILNITHSSVITKKYRISKKIHLDQDLDLYDYVEKH